MNYPIAERFVSINGEGRWAGMLALFLRFPGCNLTCSYCDTLWVNEKACPAEELTLEEIITSIQQAGVRHVTITGGEPLLQPGMEGLLASLSELEGVQVEVETNGSVSLSPFQAAAPKVSFTMDYKMPSSGMEAFMCLPNLALLREGDTLKLVCGSREDLEKARALLCGDEISPSVPVYLSPVFGRLSGAEIVTYMKAHGLVRARLQLQLHKFIWPPEQRGV